MIKQLLKSLILITAFFAFSCAKKNDDPLILPPNFAEMPDPNKPEQPVPQQEDEAVARLKDLLLKSDE